MYMDQTKIGKLIAKLRKEKGLTQRELGDKVGVGFKAVSKWERGITCPDISIINELSKILGITSDELLTGELSKEHQTNNKNTQKLTKNFLFIIPILLLINITIFIILKINNNRVAVYELASNSAEYYVEGKIIFNNDKMEIYVNKLLFYDKEFKKEIIKNYEYAIPSGSHNILNYGYISATQLLPSQMPISEFSNNFRTEHAINIEFDINKIVNNGITMNMIFLDENENLIEKSIPMSLNKYKK